MFLTKNGWCEGWVTSRADHNNTYPFYKNHSIFVKNDIFYFPFFFFFFGCYKTYLKFLYKKNILFFIFTTRSEICFQNLFIVLHLKSDLKFSSKIYLFFIPKIRSKYFIKCCILHIKGIGLKFIFIKWFLFNN